MTTSLAQESLFERTKRETDEQFYATFPDARLAAQASSSWYYNHTSQGFFEGTSFSFEPITSSGCSTAKDSHSSLMPTQGYAAPYASPTSIMSTYSTLADYGQPTEASHYSLPPGPSGWHTQPMPITHESAISYANLGYVMSESVPTSTDVHSTPQLEIASYSGQHHHHHSLSPQVEGPIMDSLLPLEPQSPATPAGSSTYADTPPSLGSPYEVNAHGRVHHHSHDMATDGPPTSGHWPGYETYRQSEQQQQDGPATIVKSESPEPSVSHPTSRHRHEESTRRGRSHSRHASRASGSKVSSRSTGWIPHRTPSPMRISPLPGHRRSSIHDKKPPLACLFCRGRKIACGPPAPGSDEKTCNQCQRRSLKCEYPLESRRGMRKKKDSEVASDEPKAPKKH
ncbi:hypothetical protein BDQ12DRAFT_29583 [Crucibulum laeve]|uniref:Zn(2)-C6 fungal-type domain-containing protein n=1 Tax=Crucibulum laeve TaxID=68775 RepID=A0A5C3MJW7_9AGAR|nr:hypothetical protein BDQ12DRAFT_29583 [Crucibulum laeve]